MEGGRDEDRMLVKIYKSEYATLWRRSFFLILAHCM
jgi:hypothetical protein